MTSIFEQNLKKYADLLVKIGVGIREGDLLQVTATVTDDPNIRKLTHYVVESAYEAGAKYVDVVWDDPMTTKLRVQHADEDSLDYVPSWMVKRLEELVDSGVARLGIGGNDPAFFADVDRAKVTQVTRATRSAIKHVIPIAINVNKWSGSAVPVQGWADKVFAEVDSPTERRAKLWDAIFAATRIYEDDPVSAWQAHIQDIVRRRSYLTEKQYTALHFSDEGTDLTVGLPQGHLWQGGVLEHGSGDLFTPNIPTEEIFTTPHRERVNGTVKASKPLSYQGQIINNFSFTFQDGRVVDFSAEQGAEVIQDLIDTDDGAKYLGEVALVPYSSPISQSGILFYNTLFDENAASHIALGRAYALALEGGTDMNDEQLIEAGANISQTHVDFMIGSASMNVDGVTVDGSREPLMRDGEWA
ncbi:MAG: aminopeptidase, partial [Chloroflexota bacterium]